MRKIGWWSYIGVVALATGVSGSVPLTRCPAYGPAPNLITRISDKCAPAVTACPARL